MPLFNLNKHKKKSGLSQDKLLLVVFRRFLSNVNEQRKDAFVEDLKIIRTMSKTSSNWHRLYSSIETLLALTQNTEKIKPEHREFFNKTGTNPRCTEDDIEKFITIIENYYLDVPVDEKSVWNIPENQKISVSDFDMCIEPKKPVDNILETKEKSITDFWSYA